MAPREQVDMVFLDIDGTIFHSGKIVQSAADAVQTLLDKDIPVALCTGRSVIHAKHIQEALGIPYGIYFNGGLVKETHQALYTAPFELRDVKNLVEFATKHDIETIIHTMHRSVALPGVVNRHRNVLAQFDFPTIDIVEDEAALFSDEVIFQVNGFMTRDWDAEFERRFPACYIYRWDEGACDFQRRKSDKSIGALHLLDHLGIDPARAVHFGDGHNDLGMFRALGWSVAMGNATDDVKRIAKHTTSSVDADGVARGLEALGLL